MTVPTNMQPGVQGVVTGVVVGTGSASRFPLGITPARDIYVDAVDYRSEVQTGAANLRIGYIAAGTALAGAVTNITSLTASTGTLNGAAGTVVNCELEDANGRIKIPANSLLVAVTTANIASGHAISVTARFSEI